MSLSAFGKRDKASAPAAWAAVAAVMITAGAAILVGCGRPAGPGVIFIVLDTLRADHVGVLGGGEGITPNLDRLASQGVLFERCYAQYPLTLPSIATMLAGQWPFVHGVRENYDQRLADAALTLPEVLRSHGFRTAAFVSALPIRKETGCAQGFDLYDDDFSAPMTFYREEFKPLESRWTGSERRGDATVERAARWLEGAERPYFLFVHLFDPHSPYDPPEPFASEQPTAYAGEVAFTDALVGRLLETVKDDADPPLVVVVSDHGEGLGEHGEWAHGFFLYNATVHVPWIIHWPGHVGPRRVATAVRLVDVAPTMLDAIGVAVPGQWTGRSAIALARGESEAPRPVYLENYFTQTEYGWSPLRAWVTPEWKWIEAPRPELYDLRADLSERRDVIAEHPDVAAEMSAALDRFVQDEREAARRRGIPELAGAIQPEARVREWLTNLGYVSAGPKPEVKGPPPDPKDEVPAWNDRKTSRFHAAIGRSALAAGEHLLALRAFREAVAAQPTAEALLGLGLTYAEMRDYAAARDTLRLALERKPIDAPALAAYAVALEATGDPRGADSALVRATAIDSAHVPAWRMLAELRARAGRDEDAVQMLSRLLRLAPDDVEALQRLARLQDERGAFGPAATCYRALAEKRPWDPVVLWRLGVAEGRVGNRDAARDALRRARERAGGGSVRDSIDAALRALDGG
jgi:arylsulfatase A-like enzyme/Flp pilus assembly protein TadD